ncbi:amidase [Hyphomonas sp. NPDC076900]|uniref:amidase n=1 Tax=unclassified Hyphomonas TaxID=2630699 RepID=UPI003CFD5573
MAELFELSATDLIAGFTTRTFSPVEVARAVLERVEQVNPLINALVFLSADEVMEAAQESEARWLKNAPLGALDGVPVTVKDSIAVRGKPMLRGNKAYEGSAPSPYDAPPTMRMREAGAIILAKTTMPDFGLLASGVSSAFGITRNPWNTAFNPGGSSSGGAAATAAMCGPVTIGSDIGGSVRFPAAMCGLVGLKPTQGRIPHLPPSPLRSAGPLTRTADDCGRMLSILSGYDARDFGALPPSADDYLNLVSRPLKGTRVALVLEGDNGGLPDVNVAASVRKAARILSDAGAIVEELPSVVGQNFMEVAMIPLMLRGLAEFLKLDEASRLKAPEAFRDSFTKALDTGIDKIALALDELETIKARVLAQMRGFDFLISPTSGISAFPAEDRTPKSPSSNALYTPVWNQTGNPALSVCCGFDQANAMPIGLQIVGHRFDDLGVLQFAKAFEEIRGFEMVWPTPSA